MRCGTRSGGSAAKPATKLLRTQQPFRIESGFIHLPDLPGLGLDINEDALKEYRRG